MWKAYTDQIGGCDCYYLALAFIFTASVLVAANRFCNNLHLYSASCLTSVLFFFFTLTVTDIFGRFFYVDDILAIFGVV